MEQDRLQHVRNKSNEATEYLKHGDYRGALNSFTAAMELLPEDKYAAKAQLSSNIGHVLVQLQQYEAAALSFGKAHEFFFRIDDRLASAEQLGNIGSVYRDMENWEDSLANYFKALAIFEELGYKIGTADQCSNIGYICSRQGAVEDALQYFGKAIDIFIELGETIKIGLCKQNIQALETLTKKRKQKKSCCRKIVDFDFLDCDDTN